MSITIMFYVFSFQKDLLTLSKNSTQAKLNITVEIKSDALGLDETTVESYTLQVQSINKETTTAR